MGSSTQLSLQGTDDEPRKLYTIQGIIRPQATSLSPEHCEGPLAGRDHEDGLGREGWGPAPADRGIPLGAGFGGLRLGTGNPLGSFLIGHRYGTEWGNCREERWGGGVSLGKLD